MWPFSDFQYGFWSSRSTADLLTVVSDRISRAFNRSGAIRAVALDISKGFRQGLPCWSSSQTYVISDQIFCLISSFVSKRRLRVALDEKSSQEYRVNVGALQDSILVPTLFLLYINDLSMLMILLFTLCRIRHLICSNS